MATYVRDYFDRLADEWLAQAYDEGATSPKFPIGEERIRVTLTAISDALGTGPTLLDLGCGGGQLCVHAATLGFTVTGVDIAPGMIAAAERLRGELAADAAARVRFVTAAFEDLDLGDEGFDAVTALGLIEYLETDDAFFRRAAALLRPGGRLAVSFRNRLYNLSSANDYTARELAGGDAARLHEELEALVRQTRPETIRQVARAMVEAASELALAADADEREPVPDLLDHPAAFAAERRQHTPSEAAALGRAAGLEPVGIRALHPHPLPSALERIAPRSYNRLALSWQRALEESPAGLVTGSSFVAIYERPA